MGRIILIIVIGLIIYALYRIIAWAIKTAGQLKETLSLKNKVETLEKNLAEVEDENKTLKDKYSTACRDIEKLEEKVKDGLQTSDSINNLSESIKTAIETPAKRKPRKKE